MKTINNLNNKQFKNQFNLLKQIVMKKQILLLIVAFFAVTSAFGQGAVHNSNPDSIACKDDALHPIAGKPYFYRVDANPADGNYLWWATRDSTFIETTAGSGTVTNNGTALTVGKGLAAVDAAYNSPTNLLDSVSITWTDSLLSLTKYQVNPTFIAMYYTNATGSCADNFKAFELDPISAFVVDIKNIDDATKAILAYGDSTEQCVDDIRGAKYVGGSMEYNYGTDTMYYEVVAANFTDSYQPYFRLSGLHAVQDSLIEWTYDEPSLWNSSTTWHAATDSVETSVTNTSTGVSIYVRVTITNNNYEGINTRDIILAVDGQNSVGNWDIENLTCVQNPAQDYADQAVQTLNPRPTINKTPPSTTSPIAPNIELLPGNEQN